MCIIVVKPKNVEFPTWRTLETCFDRNPDGAGFMWNGADNTVHIEKGFMTFSTFKKALKLAKRQMNNQTAVVMHFRIKTHGEVSKECCHPFPLEGKLERLREIECSSKYGVAHNGIITNRNTTAKKSDTMDYIMNVLYPLSKITEDIMNDKYAKHIIKDTLDGCRLALLDGDGNLDLLGNWIYDGEIAYSNSTYKPFVYGYLSANGTPVNSNWKLDKATGAYMYDAKAAEVYGFGYDDYMWNDDYVWDDDYELEKSAFEKTMRKDWPCYKCEEKNSCIDELHWFCENEHEANMFVNWTNQEYEEYE